MEQPMTYEEMMQMLQLGTENEGLDADMKRQLEQAEALRAGGAPGMRQAGRVMMAPNAMEMIGGLAKQAAAVKLAKDAEGTAGKARTNRNAQNQMLLKALMSQQQMGQPNAGQGLTLPSSGFKLNANTGY